MTEGWCAVPVREDVCFSGLRLAQAQAWSVAEEAKSSVERLERNYDAVQEHS